MLKIRHIAKLFVLCFVIISILGTSSAFSSYPTTPKIVSFVYQISDGTKESTIRNSTVIGNNLYFETYTETGEYFYNYIGKIMRTDGTPEGTIQLDSFEEYGMGGFYDYRFQGVNDKLYLIQNYTCYSPYCGGSETLLNYTTPTMTNTETIKQFANPISYVASANNLLLFDNDNDLWRSDATSTGTSKIKDFQSIISIVGAGKLAYLTANNGTNGTELWKTDGTNAGTTLVKDIVAGSESSNPQALTVSGNLLYFTTNPTTDTVRLWRSDGTPSGTFMLKDFANDFEVLHLTDVDGTLYFTYANELWYSKGTVATTTMVHTMYGVSSTRNFIPAYGMLYFKATTSIGEQLWRSDGTEIGTYPLMLNDIGRCAESNELAPFDGLVYFGICGGYNPGLWHTDGINSGTQYITSAYFVSSHIPTYLVSTNSHLFFFTKDATHGHQLWTLKNATDVVYIPLVQR